MTLLFSDLYDVGSLDIPTDTLYDVEIHKRRPFSIELKVDIVLLPRLEVDFGDTEFDGYSLRGCYVSLNTMLKIRKISGSYVHLKSDSECITLGNIFVDESLENNEDDESFVRISPFQALNLKVRNNDTITLTVSDPMMEVMTATKASISLIKTVSSLSLNHTMLKQSLHEFFAKGQILKCGEIFPVLVNTNDIFLSESLSEDENIKIDIDMLLGADLITDYSRNPAYSVIFFKVIELIDSKGIKRDKSFLNVEGFNGSTKVVSLAPTTEIVPNKQWFLSFMTNKSIRHHEALHKTIANNIFKIISTLPNRDKAEKVPNLFVSGPDATLMVNCIESMADTSGINCKRIKMAPLRGAGEDKICNSLLEYFDEAKALIPCLLVLEGIEALFPSSTGMEKPIEPSKIIQSIQHLSNGSGVLLMCTTSETDEIPDIFTANFVYSFKLVPPSTKLREEYLKKKILELELDLSEVEFEEAVNSSSGMLFSEIDVVFREANKKAILRNSFSEENSTVVLDDLLLAVAELPRSNALDVAAPRVPKVYWEDIGGLETAKREILDMIKLPNIGGNTALKSRSGILLFGPPGTGKTLLAKAVATECKLNFISVKGPELLDMYIGESERKVRKVFEMARSAKPCILFFDELDSLAPKRGRGSDSGGVMDRVVSQLLTEISSEIRQVYVIGATNRPDLLDDSLLRPGRFDRLIYLGISTDRKGQLKVLQAVTRNFELSEDVDFKNILSILEEKYGQGRLTGADLAALCNEAMNFGISRKISSIQLEVEKYPELNTRKYLKKLTDSDLKVTVLQQDFIEASKKLVPSVSIGELHHYESLRSTFGNI